jgi:NlpC/P60 family putative phage cell wall peptidase
MTPSHHVAFRARIVAHAFDWVGTPYRHQASQLRQGTDCLGLVRGVWRALLGDEPTVPPPYTPDWPETQGDEPLLKAARTYLIDRGRSEPRPGDVLLFRVMRNGPARHCGIYVGEERFVHAYSGRAVTASWLGAWWRARIAGVFAYPVPNEGDRS